MYYKLSKRLFDECAMVTGQRRNYCSKCGYKLNDIKFIDVENLNIGISFLLTIQASFYGFCKNCKSNDFFTRNYIIDIPEIIKGEQND